MDSIGYFIHEFLIHPPMAGIMTITSLVIGIGLSLLAGLLLKPKLPKTRFTPNNKPTTLSERGSFVSYILGTRRVAPVFAWAGNRRVVVEKEKVGKSSGGQKQVTGQSYFEDGWHQLCVGPATRLSRIWQNGKVIFNCPLDSVSTPSGATVAVPGHGSFDIFWGEIDQPVNTDLGASGKVGILSRWPNMCYVSWRQKNLGDQPNWGDIQYEITVEVNNPSRLSNSSAFLIDPAFEDDGVNPAHAIAQLLLDTYPHGVGLVAADLSLPLLEDVGARLQNEHLPLNMVAADGEEMANKVGEIMQDFGFLMPEVEGKLAPKLLRPAKDIPVLDDDVIAPPEPEIIINMGEKPSSNLIFKFQDRNINYKDSDITLYDDQEGTTRGRPKRKNVEIPNAIHITTASKIADRRQNEELSAVRTFKYKGLRGARILAAGQVFNRSDKGDLRVVGIGRLDDDPLVSIECIKDIYGNEFSGYEAIVSDPVNQILGVEIDDDFDFFEPPFRLSSGEKVISVLRDRAHDQIVGAFLHLSPDGLSFTNTANQDIAATKFTFISGGDTIPNTDDSIIEDGPVVTILGDSAAVENLDADLVSWFNGKQQCLINNELFYLRSIVAVTATTFRLKGLIRAREGSYRIALSHGFPSKGWIFLKANQDLVTSDFIVLSQALFLKTQPFDNFESVDLSLVTAIEHNILGTYNAPYYPTSFRADNIGVGSVRRLGFYPDGSDCIFKWANRIRDSGNGSAASEQGAGTATTIPATSVMDGELVIEIRNVSDVLKRTIVKSTNVETHTYTAAEIAFDFTTPPTAFKAVIRQRDGTFESPTREFTITKI